MVNGFVYISEVFINTQQRFPGHAELNEGQLRVCGQQSDPGHTRGKPVANHVSSGRASLIDGMTKS